MSRNYKFHNPEGLCFVSFAVVNWLDVFILNKGKTKIIRCFTQGFREKLKTVKISLTTGNNI